MHSTVRPHAHHNFTFRCPSLLPARRWQDRSCSRIHRPFQPLQAHRVEIEHAAGVTTLEVEEGQTILETALDAGLDLSHDCKMGVGLSNVFPGDSETAHEPVALAIAGVHDLPCKAGECFSFAAPFPFLRANALLTQANSVALGRYLVKWINQQECWMRQPRRKATPSSVYQSRAQTAE